MNRGPMNVNKIAKDNYNMSAENKKRLGTKGVLRRLFSYMIKYWHLFVIAIILTLLSNQLSLLGPKYSGDAIDAITSAKGVDFPSVWDCVYNEKTAF